ncbi:MAG: M28 family peptidase [Flavobacteriales bacterium]|jgi:Zn-dependent M28 family amino/carboxypeptidase|nr:M28 family peptidase [Flavobacteriales bacterium]MBT7481095.1 M28 family peptidase [Flavobacteriales bacterium]
MIKFRYTILVVITIILFACTSDPEQTQEITPKKQKVKVDVPIFNADSAYYFVEKQVSFGPRVISSKGWKNCAIWLEKKMKTYTPNVIIQEALITTYDGKNHTLKNIIATFSPEKNNRIALFAHWDSRHIADHDTENKDSPILGANDGGSGVGVLLEMARQFSLKNPKIGVDIILFDAEDYGQPENSGYPTMQDSWCLGSQHWSGKPHKINYYAKYGILLDMVGGVDATFYREGYSMKRAPDIVEKVWNTANNSGFGNHFVYQNSPDILDDHVYVNYVLGIPTIDIIEYDPRSKNNFNKHWHTHKDDMNNIDRETLNAIGQTLLEVVYRE